MASLRDLAKKAVRYFDPESNEGDNFWNNNNPLLKGLLAGQRAGQKARPRVVSGINNLADDSPAAIAESIGIGMGKAGINFVGGTVNNLARLGERVSGIDTPDKIINTDRLNQILFEDYRVTPRSDFGEGAGQFAFDTMLLTSGANAIKGTKLLKPAQQYLGREAAKRYSIGGLGNRAFAKGIAEVSQSLPYTGMSATRNLLEGGNVGAGFATDIVIDTLIGQFLGKNFGRVNRGNQALVEQFQQALKERNEELLNEAIKIAKEQGYQVDEAMIPQLKAIINQTGSIGGLSAKSFQNLEGDRLTNQLIKKRAFSNVKDKGLRFFISDRQANLKRSGLKEAKDRGFGTLDEIFSHPQFYKEYPQARNITVNFDPKMGANGSYNESANKIILNPNNLNTKTLGTLLHENQHFIQGVEGFSRGGSPEQVLADAFEIRNSIVRKLRSVDNPEQRKVLLEELEKADKVAFEGNSFEGYRRLMAEVEARAATDFRGLTQSEGRGRDVLAEQMKKEGIRPEDLILKDAKGISYSENLDFENYLKRGDGVPTSKKFDTKKLGLDTGFYRVSDTGAVSASYDPQSTAAIRKIVSEEKAYDRAIKESIQKSTPKKATPLDVSSLIGKNTNSSQWDIKDMKDINTYSKGFKDVYRNFERVFGDQFPKVKRIILDPFDASKGRFVDMQENLLKELDEKIVKELGIEKGSDLSRMVQEYGELDSAGKGVYLRNLSPEDARKVIKADTFFRTKYDELLKTVNKSIARIYPNQPDKLIPRRDNYYRHFREMTEGIGGIKNLFDTPANIPAELSGTSAFTKPKQKFLSIAQKRLGNKTDVDAVGGYLNYIRQASYATHIDPEISKFRNLASDLEKLTDSQADPVAVGKLNNFLWFLREYANGLAGKTNPLDRPFQDMMLGRTTIRALNWLNNRVKANVILGNVSSALAQPFNIPQAVGDMGITHFMKGAGTSLTSILDPSTPMKQSSFIKERYFDGYAQFDTSLLRKEKKLAKWITGVFDEVSTKAIWNGYYDKAIKDGVDNPVKWADDLTRKMVAGRGVGEVPLIQQSKMFQIAAPFQLEVTNLWHVFSDWTGEGGAKASSKMMKYAIAAYFMNRVVKDIRGSDVSFNPIQATMDAYKEFSEEDNKRAGVIKAGGRLTGEVLSNIPIGQTIAGAYDEYGGGALGSVVERATGEKITRKELFGDKDPTRFGGGLLVGDSIDDPLFKAVPPFGGQQIKRMLEGLQTQYKGYSETDKDGVRFTVEQSPKNFLKNLLFGQYSTSEAREYFDENNRPLTEKQSEIFKQGGGKEYYDAIQYKRDIDTLRDKIKKGKEEGKNTEKLENSLLQKVSAAEIGMDVDPDFYKEIYQPMLKDYVRGEGPLPGVFKDYDEATIAALAFNYTDYLGNNAPGLEGEKQKQNLLRDARSIYKNEDIPEDIKKELISKHGYDYSDIELDVVASGSVLDRAIYVRDALEKNPSLLGSFVNDETVSGKRIATKAVLDKLGLEDAYDSLKKENTEEKKPLIKTPKKAKIKRAKKVSVPVRKTPALKIKAAPKISIKSPSLKSGKTKINFAKKKYAKIKPKAIRNTLLKDLTRLG